MKAGFGMRITLWLLVGLSTGSLLISEFLYDARGAIASVLIAVILFLSASAHLMIRPVPAAGPVRLMLKGLVVLGLFVMLCVLLFGHSLTSMDRAFLIARLALIVLSLQFWTVRRSTHYGRILIGSLVPVVVAAVTGGSIFLLPFFVGYMVMLVYFLILFQIQCQIDRIGRSRHVGYEPDEQQKQLWFDEVRLFWSQCRPFRFNVTVATLLVSALVFAAMVFYAFPRLQSGDLLGSNFQSRQVTGFTERVTLGELNNSEDNKQVVARVKISQDGQSLGDVSRPLYLRFSVLDIYRDSPFEEGKFQWSRSFINQIYARPVKQGFVVAGPDNVIQEVMLNPCSAAYLPGCYPIIGIEGIDNEEKLLLGKLDRVVEHLKRLGNKTYHYRVASAAQLSDVDIYEGFRQRLSLMGAFWGRQGRFGPIRDEVYQLVERIASDLIDRRTELQKAYFAALEEWQAYQTQQLYASRQEMYRLRWTNAEPNSVPRETPSFPSSTVDVELEESLCRAVYEQALKLSDIDRALADRFCEFLQENCTYSLEAPPAEPYAPEYEIDEETREEVAIYPDPIEVFLSPDGRVGNCEYFASAMIRMCRAVQIPARMATGYLAMDYLEEFDYYLVRQRDAHAWVEIYTADQDWVRYDPTPPGSDGDRQPPFLAGLLSGVSNQFERLQYRWLSHITNYRPELEQAPELSETVTDWIESIEDNQFPVPGQAAGGGGRPNLFREWFTHHRGEPYVHLYLRWIIFFLFLIDLSIGCKELYNWLIPWYLQRRAHKRLLASYADSDVDFYRHMLKMLQQIDYYKPPHLTPREFAVQAQAFNQDFKPIGRVSEAYNKVCYGDEKPDEKEWESVRKAIAHLEQVIKSIRKFSPRPWPWEGQVPGPKR